MKRLTLLRHAKAVEASASGVDHDRALAERGLRAAEQVGHALGSDLPELVLCSSSRRTVETSNALTSAWQTTPSITIDRRLYLADASALLTVIGETGDQITSLWLIGHNPGLHDPGASFGGKRREPEQVPGTVVSFSDLRVRDFSQRGDIMEPDRGCRPNPGYGRFRSRTSRN